MSANVGVRDPMQRPGLGANRLRVFEQLLAAAESVAVLVVAERVGLHPNTTRFHLDALVESGLALRSEEHGQRPGRPRVLYRATHDSDGAGPRSYRLLAEILAGHMAAHTRRPVEDALSAGREWGRSLAQLPAPFHRTTAPEATRELVAALTDVGFAPEAVITGQTSQLRLTHCPSARSGKTRSGGVLGALGIRQRLFAEIDAPVEVARIGPFAEPSTCLVHPCRTGRPRAGLNDRRRPRSVRASLRGVVRNERTHLQADPAAVGDRRTPCSRPAMTGAPDCPRGIA